MSKYTPDTDMVRMRYVFNADEYNVELNQQFDRWLAQHEETIKAVAWEEGARAERTYQWRLEDADAAGQGVMILREPNPYTSPIKEDN